MAEQCYICGKPATQTTNIMLGAAASAGSIFKPVCTDHGYRDPRDALIAAQSARIAELEELEAGCQKYIDIIVAASEKEHTAYEAQSAALALAEGALQDTISALEIYVKHNNPTWDGSAESFSAIGRARSALAALDAVKGTGEKG